MAQEPGRQNPGIIHHQTVTGIQVVQNIIKMLMLHLSRCAVQEHQTGCIPFFQRCLGNQFLREIIEKVMGFQSFGSSKSCGIPSDNCIQYTRFSYFLQQAKGYIRA